MNGIGMMAWWKKKSNDVLPFVFEINTANTSTGSTTNTQFKLPLLSTGTYDFDVDWGDTNSNNITVWNESATTHTYGSTGTYTITITGNITGFRFANTGDRLKILDIQQWGVVNVGNPSAGLTTGAFDGCSNLNITATDIPDFTGMNSLFRFFQGCSSLVYNSSIDNWDVSNITDMIYTFFGCSSFNQPLNNWDVSNVTNMGGMFRQASTFNQPLNNWDVSNVLAFDNNSGMFEQATAFNQNLSSWVVSSCTNFSRMFSLSGFNNGGDSGINNWNVSSATLMGQMFANCPFNQPLNLWNVSNVTSFLGLSTGMFGSNTVFNQNIGSWNVGNCVNFQSMFLGATAFNNAGSDSIKDWNVSSGTNFSLMFRQSAFNQPIGIWSIGSAINISQMFFQCPFNQNIGSWNVSNVTNFSGVFQNNSAFNQNINSWNVSKGTNFSNMFSNATGFNQALNSWVFTTTANIAMNLMFNAATAFNQNLGSWDVQRVTNFTSMFAGATNFNNGGSDSIKDWVFSTTDKSMGAMFQNASNFNQPIGSWDVKDTTLMNNMFQNATAFNQNIGGWNVAKVSNFNNFMAGKTNADYSAANLDAIYNGWSALTFVNTGLIINFNTIKYTAAGSAGRAVLTSAPNNWTITDGGI